MEFTLRRICILAAVMVFVMKTQILRGQCPEYDIINMKKTALVVGVRSYKNGSLAHTLNDALDITDSLRKLGFTVFPYLDPDKDKFDDAVTKWIGELGNYNVALFYFSGHGAEGADGNYLFPVDAAPTTESELISKCVSANSILERISKTSVSYKVMILDACRDNPFTKGWTKGLTDGGGLSSMSGKGAYIGFAAAPGKTASDGNENDRNGTYTAAILKYITSPNRTIDEIFTDVTATVEVKSDGKQEPFRGTSLSAPFCLSVKHLSLNVKISGSGSFNQSSSDIALSNDEQEIVTVDDKAGEILVLDANSFDRLYSKSTNYLGSSIVCKSGKKIYILDTAKRAVKILRMPDLAEDGSISINGYPITLAVSDNEKEGYVSYQDSLSGGYIDKIDLVAQKVVRTISTFSDPSGIALSGDNRNLYVISHGKRSRNLLLALDTKSFKVRTVTDVACGTGIGVSPDGNKIYVSADTSLVLAQTNVIDAKSLKILNSIPVKAKLVSFTVDGKYVFLTNDKTSSIVKVDSDLLVNNLSFFTPAKGVICTRDGRIIVWLPEEKSPALYNISEIRKKVDLNVQDPRLQEYNRRMRRNLQHSFDSLAFKRLNTVKDTIFAFPDKFAKQLEGDYRGNSGAETFTDNDSMVVYSGLTLNMDEHKAIQLGFHLKYDHGYIYIDYQDRMLGGTGKIDYKFHAEAFEWGILEKKLNEIYLDRINSQLSLKDKVQ